MNNAETSTMSSRDSETQGERILPALIFLSTIVLVGTPGNVLVLYIYKFRMKASAIRSFILTMAGLDLSVCLIDLPLEMVDIRFKHTFGSLTVLCKTFHLLHDFFSIASMYMLVAVGVERYMKVCRPLQRQMTIRGATVSCTMLCIVSFILAVPAWFKYGMKETILPNVSFVSGAQCSIADGYSPTLVTYNYVFWIVQDIGVLLSLVILYSLIWRTVYRQSRYCEKIRPKISNTLANTSSASYSSSSVSESNSNIDPASNQSANGVMSQDFRLTEQHEDVPDTSRDTPEVPGRHTGPHKHESDAYVSSMTSVMCLVTLVCFLAYLPIVCDMIIGLIDRDASAAFEKRVSWFYGIFVRTYYIQCACNPVIYSFRGTRFRQEMMLIWRNGFHRNIS